MHRCRCGLPGGRTLGGVVVDLLVFLHIVFLTVNSSPLNGCTQYSVMLDVEAGVTQAFQAMNHAMALVRKAPAIVYLTDRMSY